MGGFSNVSGEESIVFADNASFDGTERGGALSSDGELWIGSTTAPHVVKGHITAGTGVTVANSSGNITITASGAVPLTVNGDSGTATPSGNALTIAGGTGLTSVGSGSTLTMNLDTPVSLANGGTNSNLTASNGGVFYSTSTAGAILSGTATARQMLQSGASTTPAWSTATYPATTTANQILYSSAANTVSEITTAANGILRTDSSSVPAIGNTLTGDFTYSSSGSGVVRTVTVQNTSNTASSGALIKASSAGSSAGDATYTASTTTTDWSWGVDNSVTSPTADPWVLSQSTALGTNNAMSFDTSLRAQIPNQPFFIAYRNAIASNVTGDGTVYTVIYDSTWVNRGSVFNTTTGVFTAPIDGVYMLGGYAYYNGMISSHTSGNTNIVTTDRTYRTYLGNPWAAGNGDSLTTGGTVLAHMTAGQTAYVTVQISGGTKIADIALGTNSTVFWGYLLG